MVTPRRTHRHITVHVRVKWHQLKNIFTGQWGPKTKIWLRAMSTRFQASARLSWSGADAFVPGTARERALVTPGLAAGLGGTGRGARSTRWPCVVPGRLRSAAASPLLRSGSSGHSGPTAVGGQRRNPVTLGPSSAGGQEARDCPDTCRARPRGAAPSYGAAGTARPGSQPSSLLLPSPSPRSRKAGGTCLSPSSPERPAHSWPSDAGREVGPSSAGRSSREQQPQGRDVCACPPRIEIRGEPLPTGTGADASHAGHGHPQAHRPPNPPGSALSCSFAPRDPGAAGLARRRSSDGPGSQHLRGRGETGSPAPRPPRAHLSAGPSESPSPCPADPRNPF